MSLDVLSTSKTDYLIVFPVGLLINAIPLAPGGLGIGEYGFQCIFLLFGSDMGAELGILFHAVIFILSIGLGGLVYMFSNISRREIVTGSYLGKSKM